MSTIAVFGLVLLEVVALGLVFGICLYAIRHKTVHVGLLVYAFLIAILGLALVWHKPYWQFGFLHWTVTVFFVYSGFLLLKLKKYNSIIECSFALLALVLTVAKFFYPVMYSDRTLYTSLPLNICNIAQVLIIFRPLYKKYSSDSGKGILHILDNYLICFAFLGAMANFAIGSEYGYLDGEVVDFFRLRTFESNTIHNLYFAYVIYMLLSKEIAPDKKAILKNFFWLLPMSIVLIFTNQIWHYNFFFTSQYENPILFLYRAMPSFDITIRGTVFEINLIYHTLLIVMAALCAYFVSMFFEYIDKKTIIV